MCAYRMVVRTALQLAVGSLILISPIITAQDAAAFGVLRTGTQGSGETCAFTLQMDKVTFRMRYMQKVAKFQDGVSATVGAVEEMYSNVKQASLFSDEEDGGSAEALSNVSGVDPLSVDCLGCHDGSSASNVSINLKNDPYKRARMGLSSGGASDHPIGMDYASYAGRGDDYKPIFGKNKMVLVNGKVGCLTCHDPLNKEKGHLVMSDRGSALCLTCHGK